MHIIQKKLLHQLHQGPLDGLTLRDIASAIGEDGSPQKIKHHIEQLVKKGLVSFDPTKKKLEKVSGGKISGTPLVMLPIYGTADCGVATHFADDHPEGYLRVSQKLLGEKLIKKFKDLFVVRAAGKSMNRASIAGESIEPGDYIIVDTSDTPPKENEYVLSVIDGVANIKKIHVDRARKQIVLSSESNENIAPIFLHEDDLDSYVISGKVVRVMKDPAELQDMTKAASVDTLRTLGPMSEEEHSYYQNL